MLADLTHSSSCSPVSLSKWKSMLLSPHITSIYATMVTWFMGVLDRMVWGRGCPQNRSSCLLDYWTLLEWLLMTFGVQALLQPSLIGEIYPCAPCPNVFLTNFLIMPLPSPWPFSQTIAHSQWISDHSLITHGHTSDHFSFQEKCTLFIAWNSTHCEDFSLLRSFTVGPERSVHFGSCPLLGGAGIACRVICEKGPSLLLAHPRASFIRYIFNAWVQKVL